MAYGICDSLGDMWAIRNAVDTATVSGTAASADLGVDRVRDPRLGKFWRTAAGGSTITLQFPTPVPLQMFGVFGVSIPTATLTLDIGTTYGSSNIRSGAWNPTRNEGTKQCFWLNAVERGPQVAAPLVAEIRLGIAEGGVDVGRIWASDYSWTPGVSHTVGSEQRMLDLSAVQRTRRSGAVLADRAPRQRTHTIKYDMVSTSEWNYEVLSIDYYAGMHKQVLFVPNYLVYPPDRHAILGYQEDMSPIANISYDRWGRVFNLRECG